MITRSITTLTRNRTLWIQTVPSLRAHSSRLDTNSSRLKDHSSRWRNLRWNISNSGSRRGFQQSWALCKYWIFPKVSCTRDIFTRSSSLRLLDMACVSWDKNEHVCNVFASTNLMKWNEEISKRWRPRVWLPCFEKPLMPKACADKIYLFKGMCWTKLSIFPRHQLNVSIGLFKGQCQKNSISKGRQWKNEPFSEASGQWLDPPIIIVSKPDWVWWWSCGRVTARQYSDARIQNRNLRNSLEPKYFVFW